MKKILIPGLFILVMGCNPSPDVESLLQNPVTQDKIFTSILEDHELMNLFMTKMQSNNHAMMMMSGNQDMMGHMMGQSNMGTMMQDHPEVMQNMMSNMLSNRQSTQQMMRMMQEKGILSEDCLESGMKMLN